MQAVKPKGEKSTLPMQFVAIIIDMEIPLRISCKGPVHYYYRNFS